MLTARLGDAAAAIVVTAFGSVLMLFAVIAAIVARAAGGPAVPAPVAADALEPGKPLRR